MRSGIAQPFSAFTRHFAAYRWYIVAGIAVPVAFYVLSDTNQTSRESDPMTTDEATAALIADRWTKAFVDQIEQARTGPDDSTKRLYHRVMDEFHHHDYQAAQAGFQFFLALYPQSPLAIPAHYWVGECAFRGNRYTDAIAAFDTALSHAPLNPSVAAAALMKKGLSYARLGQRGRSRHLLELVVALYPESHEAAVARKSLKLP
jgi:tol-pal system protein YbgF